jgi:N utilization substance protein B
VELAKRFGSDSAPRFINGVLGTLAQREQEIRRQFQLAG